MTDLTKWGSPTLVTMLSTELNGQTNQSIVTSTGGTSPIPTPFDNTSTRYVYADVEVFINFSSGTPSSIALCSVMLFQGIDGTNFDPATRGFPDTMEPLLAVIIPVGQAAATPQRVVARQVPVPPEKFFVSFSNQTGLTFPTSGNTCKFLFYGYYFNG